MDSERFTSSLTSVHDFRKNIISLADLPNREYDVVVVGSGCGGGLVVGRLVEEGKRVLVVEKGKYVHPEEMTLLEEDANKDMFENGGIVSTTDGCIQFLGQICLFI